MIRGAIRTSRALAAALLACVGFCASAADLKIATVAPDGSHWMQQMRVGAEEIKTRTAGRVTLSRGFQNETFAVEGGWASRSRSRSGAISE